jgi:hypothetical protein
MGPPGSQELHSQDGPMTTRHVRGFSFSISAHLSCLISGSMDMRHVGRDLPH